MYRAAESIAEVYNELCLIVADEPELLDSFFALSPYQKAMWLASQPLWHGIARADVFVTAEGLQIAELNCDTPTGEALHSSFPPTVEVYHELSMQRTIVEIQARDQIGRSANLRWSIACSRRSA